MRTELDITTELDLMIANRMVQNIETEEQRVAYIQAKVIEEAKKFLSSTDWYIVRFLETGVAVPSDITAARAAARLVAV